MNAGSPLSKNDRLLSKNEPLNKNELASISKTRIAVYSDLEKYFLTTYAPYRFGAKPLDVSNRLALLEASQIFYEFLSKVDHSAAHRFRPQSDSADGDIIFTKRGSTLIGEKLPLLHPLLTQLGYLVHFPDSDSPEVIWKFKQSVILALKKVVKLLETKPISDLLRAADSFSVVQREAYSVSALHNARDVLVAHFKKYYDNLSLILDGSFVHHHPSHPRPCSMDWRIVLPFINSIQYDDHLSFAHSLLETSPVILSQNGESKPVSITFSLVGSEFVHTLALSDPLNLYAPGHSLLFNCGLAIPTQPETLGHELKLSAVFQNVMLLRAALAEPEVYSDPIRLKAKLNLPYYTRLMLQQVFGKIPDSEPTPRFPLQTLTPAKTLEALVEANLSMQNILLAYGDLIEKNLADGTWAKNAKE